MKYYAIATDTVRNEPFGIVVKDGRHSVCHGLHAAGHAWADLYNAGETKTPFEGLPADIELSPYGPLGFDVDAALGQESVTIPTPQSPTLVDSVWEPNRSTGIGLKNVSLTQIPGQSRQLAIDYKAHAFLNDTTRSSLLLTVRLANGSMTPEYTGFQSKSMSRHEYSHLALGDASMRRAAKDVMQTKMRILLNRPRTYAFLNEIPEEDIKVKGLGRTIGQGGRRARRIARGAARSAAGFDPNARDADLDMLIQEGTAWERPKLPGKPDLPETPGLGKRRTPKDRDRAARGARARVEADDAAVVRGHASERLQPYDGSGANLFGTDINPDWDIRDPEYRREWHESEMGPGRDAVGKLHTDNVRMEIIPASDVMEGDVGWTVSGEYRDLESSFGNRAEWLYDAPVFDTPEEAASWADSLDRAIDNDISYEEWEPPEYASADPDAPRVVDEPDAGGYASARPTRDTQNTHPGLPARPMPAAEFLRNISAGQSASLDRNFWQRFPDSGWKFESRSGGYYMYPPDSIANYIKESHLIARHSDGEGGYKLPDDMAKDFAARLGVKVSKLDHRNNDHWAVMKEAVDQVRYSQFEKISVTDSQDERRLWSRLSQMLQREGEPTHSAAELKRDMDQLIRNGGWGKIGPVESSRGDKPEVDTTEIDKQIALEIQNVREGMSLRDSEGPRPKPSMKKKVGISTDDTVTLVTDSTTRAVLQNALDNLAAARSRGNKDQEALILKVIGGVLDGSEGDKVAVPRDGGHFTVLSDRDGKDWKETYDGWDGAVREAQARLDGLEIQRSQQADDALEGTDWESGHASRRDRAPDQDFNAFWNQLRTETESEIAKTLDELDTELGKPDPNPETVRRLGRDALDSIETSRERGYASARRPTGDRRRRRGESVHALRGEEGTELFDTDQEDLPEDEFSAGYDSRGRMDAAIKKSVTAKDKAWRLSRAERQAAREENDTDLNKQIFTDRMGGMSTEAMEEEYGMDRAEIRSRDAEHVATLAGEERYEAQPNLNKEIFDDRMGGMSLDGAAEKHGIERTEVRAREATHSRALVGQESYHHQPNLNQRIFETRLRDGMSMDQASEQFRMDPAEIRAREIAHLDELKKHPPRKFMGLAPEIVDRGEGADRTVSWEMNPGNFQRKVKGQWGHLVPIVGSDGKQKHTKPKKGGGGGRPAGLFRAYVHGETLSDDEKRVMGELNMWDPDSPPTPEYERGRRAADQGVDLSGYASQRGEDDDRAKKYAARAKRLKKEFEGVSDDDLEEEMSELEIAQMQADGGDSNVMEDIKYHFGSLKKLEARLNKLWEEIERREGEREPPEAPDIDEQMRLNRTAAGLPAEGLIPRRREGYASQREQIVSSTGNNGPKLAPRAGRDWNVDHELRHDRDRFNREGHWVEDGAHGILFKPYDKETKKEAQSLLDRRLWLRRHKGEADVDRELEEIENRLNDIGSTKLMRRGGGDGYASARNPLPEDTEAPVVDEARVAALNRQIDNLRTSPMQRKIDEIEAAKEAGDDKAVYRLTKQLREIQEEESELREQLGEAMGVGRVSFGYKSSRVTNDWDADWEATRENAETTLNGIADELTTELAKGKPDKKRIDELKAQHMGAIQGAQRAGLASQRGGRPWMTPERSRANTRFWKPVREDGPLSPPPQWGQEPTDTSDWTRIERWSDRGGRSTSERVRAAVTERTAAPGYASRRSDTLDTEKLTDSYTAGTPRLPGTRDGEIWEALGGANMSDERAARLAIAAERLEKRLLNTSHIPTVKELKAMDREADAKFGRDAPGYKKGETIFDGVKAGNLLQTFIDDLYGKQYPDEPVPSVQDFRLRMRTGRDHALLQIAIKETFSYLDTGSAKDKRRLEQIHKAFDSLSILARMREFGNYEAIEQLHPKHQRMLLDDMYATLEGIGSVPNPTSPIGGLNPMDHSRIAAITGTIGKNSKGNSVFKPNPDTNDGKSTAWKFASGYDTAEDFHAKKTKFRTRGSERPSLRTMVSDIMRPGAPAEWLARRREDMARARAIRQGRPVTQRPGAAGVHPWDKVIVGGEVAELKTAVRVANRDSRKPVIDRVGAIAKKRTKHPVQRDTAAPAQGAAAQTTFAGPRPGQRGHGDGRDGSVDAPDVVDVMDPWQEAEGRPTIGRQFLKNMAFLTRIRRKGLTEEDKERRLSLIRAAGTSATSAWGDEKMELSREIIAHAQSLSGHSDLPEVISADQLAELFVDTGEIDADGLPIFELLPGYMPIQRGLGAEERAGVGTAGGEGATYWQQFVRLRERFISRVRGAGHGAGENHARPPVDVKGTKRKVGNLYGGYGVGTGSFLTPESKVIDWGKLSDIRDETDAITEAIEAGLSVLPSGNVASQSADASGGIIFDDPDNFTGAVRSALAAAETRAGGHLQVPKKSKDRTPHDPLNPPEMQPTGSGKSSLNQRRAKTRVELKIEQQQQRPTSDEALAIAQAASRGDEAVARTTGRLAGSTLMPSRDSRNMGNIDGGDPVKWQNTEFGTMIDQFLKMFDEARAGGDMSAAEKREFAEAWEYLMTLTGSLEMDMDMPSFQDFQIFDLLPIFGYDAVVRHGGVVNVSNRGALLTLDHPVSGPQFTKIVEDLGKKGRLAGGGADEVMKTEVDSTYGKYRKPQLPSTVERLKLRAAQRARERAA